MPRVSHHFVVGRPISAVFDVVTTARFWPEWHPATRSVEGDIGHPARLGDQIIEHVTIAGIHGSGTWTVVEHERPHRLVLETDLAFGHLRISYQADHGRRRAHAIPARPGLPRTRAAGQCRHAGPVRGRDHQPRPPGAARNPGTRSRRHRVAHHPPGEHAARPNASGRVPRPAGHPALRRFDLPPEHRRDFG